MSDQMKRDPSDKKSDHERAQRTRQGKVDFWANEIWSSIRWNRPWLKRGQATVDTYRAKMDAAEHQGPLEIFNILWANTETLRPVIYSHTPKPEVERKFLEGDQVGSNAALIMERLLSAMMGDKASSFDDCMEKVCGDYLLPGRGTARVVYKATFEKQEVVVQDQLVDPETGLLIQEAVTEEQDVKTGEKASARYVFWKDFLHTRCRLWRDVWWVAYGEDMTRSQLVQRFGNRIGRNIPLAGNVYQSDAFRESDGAWNYQFARDRNEQFARVWEIWDKRAKKRLFISEGYDKIIEETPDPYELPEFFPSPEPLYSIATNGVLVPIPEYTMYQHQANELNILTIRCTRLADALKARGVCDAEIVSLQRLFDGEDNLIIPDENFAKIMSAGGLEKAIAFAPIQTIAQTLAIVAEQRRRCLNDIYEITGISDIMRAASDPRETATAVRKKGQYGSIRVRKRQKAVQKFAADVTNLLGQLIANFFDEQTVIRVAGIYNRPDLMQTMPQVMQVFRSEDFREYTIAIETDSTIAVEDFERKEEATEFAAAMSSILGQLIPAVQEGVIPKMTAQQMMMYLVRRFEAGRDLENAITLIGQQPEQPQDDGSQQAEAMKAQAEQAKIQIEQGKLQMKAQELQLEQAKLQQEIQVEVMKAQIEMAKLQAEMEMADAANQVKLITEQLNVEATRINAQGGRGGAN